MNELNTTDVVWAFIPARGGSKSIPLKNMAKLNGRPLIDYAIQSAKASGSVKRIFCSSDHDRIVDFCRKGGVEVQIRPSALSGDSVSTLDVMIYFLETLLQEEGSIADILLLLEPTSPFLLPAVIDDCVSLLRQHPEADSVQSVTTLPPNHHAFNQRYIKDGLVRFSFPKERAGRFTKQSKPDFYVHGNLRAIRCRSLLHKRDIFGDISLPYIIPRLYATDVDGPEDLELAELYLTSRKVVLPHLHESP